MKNILFTSFRVLLILVLIAKILNWFLKFSEETNQVLNAAMFCLIGVAYIYMGFVWDKKLVKLLIVFCGIFLILMNFVPERTWITIVGIVCILVPMIIARFQKKEKENALIEN